MNIQQAAAVLAKAAAVDNRDVGEANVMAWHEVIGDIDYRDALDAVTRHRTENPGVYLEPGHIRRLAKLIRDERSKGQATRALPPGRFEDDPSRRARATSGAAKVRELLAQLAAARSVPEAEQDTPQATPSQTIHARALARARAEKKLIRS